MKTLFTMKWGPTQTPSNYNEHVPESIHVTVDVRILARIDKWSIPLSTIRKPQYRNLIPKKIINQGHYKHHILFQHFLGDVVACCVWKLPTKILNQAWKFLGMCDEGNAQPAAAHAPHSNEIH